MGAVKEEDLPIEVRQMQASEAEGQPEHTFNAATDDEGPEGEVEDYEEKANEVGVSVLGVENRPESYTPRPRGRPRRAKEGEEGGKESAKGNE